MSLPERHSGLRARLRALAGNGSSGAAPAGAEAPPARAEAPPAPLLTWEERFPLDAGFPADLFGGGFAWPETGGAPLVFWDLETCGLQDAPIFLIGSLRPSGGGLLLSLVLARDPSEEPVLLRRAAAILGLGATWVTFNGRSFDAPRLRRRAALHGVELPSPADHHDLLHLVRRRWKSELPDCRLSTVERRLLGLERSPDDVPGREVPERYWDYVRTRDLRWLRPVLAHNRRDVAAMAVLYARLRRDGDLAPPPPGS